MLREAAETDYLKIWDIYMHENVNPYMDYELMDQDAFHTIFIEYQKTSKFYVLEKNNVIVAMCRLTQFEGSKSHIISIGSVGTNQKHLRHGYATTMLNSIILLVKETMPEIVRIELLVEEDNNNALLMYKKLGFNYEATYPNWFKRFSGIYKDKASVSSFLLAKLIKKHTAISPIQNTQSIIKEINQVSFTNYKNSNCNNYANKLIKWYKLKQDRLINNYNLFVYGSREKTIATCFINSLNIQRCNGSVFIDLLTIDNNYIHKAKEILIELVNLLAKQNMQLIILSIISTDYRMLDICLDTGFKNNGLTKYSFKQPQLPYYLDKCILVKYLY